MNTRILLAVAGALALSACAKNKIAKAEIVEEPSRAAATARSPVPANRRPGPALPTAMRPGGTPIFRTPDATRTLYDEKARLKGSPSGRRPESGDSTLSVSPPDANLPVIPSDLPVEPPIGQSE